MALTLDEDDPCATARALRLAYARLVAGETAGTVSFTGGRSGASRSVGFQGASAERLLQLIRSYEAQCAKKEGRAPSHRAMAAGGVR